MGVRRRSASVASSGSRNTRSALCKPLVEMDSAVWAARSSRKPAPRVPPVEPRSYGVIPTFAVPESGCPVVSATYSR